MTFGDTLKAYRIASGLTQDALANKIGTTKQAIWRYENSAREPNVRTARLLASALGVPLSVLLSSSAAEHLGKEKAPIPADVRAISSVGNRIRTRREALGLSQDELAKRLGYKSRSSINKIELDQRNLTQSKIKSISDVLDTTPAYIMGWVDAANPEKPAAESGIGERIRLSREALGLTQDELGAACGTSKQTIYKYESGIITNIPLDKLQQIAARLHVSPAYLTGWSAESAHAKEPAAESGSGLLEQELISLLSQLSPADFARVKALAALTPQELQKLLDYAELLLAARKA